MLTMNADGRQYCGAGTCSIDGFVSGEVIMRGGDYGLE
jgi:hypothetical protein